VLKDDAESYEPLLETCFNVARMFELRPGAFKNMDEEDLRWQFITQLNPMFPGRVTGETYNVEGKTDILVKFADQTQFVAECKFWRGPKSLKDAVDQLLRDVSWQDTKTAILLFNRTKGFSAVLSQVPGVIADHPNFVSHDASYGDERRLRFVLHHNRDKGRHLFLTVLAFDVPAPEGDEPSPQGDRG
jgi:hypothetical protein